eukprot:TRINITY_DN30766_c0_g1_i1.p1 TRINITY_DN30766_c0_g1~~TRINITY_DN30766_c0_g1_i1.p1  ORF type:complete len:482 (+),score=110.40 TRINITY_DN30766_c0_g1_i1:101-1546(+)
MGRGRGGKGSKNNSRGDEKAGGGGKNGKGAGWKQNDWYSGNNDDEEWTGENGGNWSGAAQDSTTTSWSGGGQAADGGWNGQNWAKNEASSWSGAGWNGSGSKDVASTSAAAASPSPLASQWRFATRVLSRHSPEEVVRDARRQLRLGDHVFVRRSWDFSEVHGIVVSVGGDDYGRSRREDSNWVVYWSGNKLHCVSASQFSRGDNLYRVSYPVWGCSFYVPTASTMKPYIEDARHLAQDQPDEAVAKQANAAYQGGNASSSWRPNWSQAQDVEFCLSMKLGGRSLPLWEVHSRHTLRTTPVAPLGCLMRGDVDPARLLGGEACASASPSMSAKPPPPGFSGNHRRREGDGKMALELQSALATQPAGSGYSDASDQSPSQPQAQGWQMQQQQDWGQQQQQSMYSSAGMRPYPAAAPQAGGHPAAASYSAYGQGGLHGQLSATAQVFVPNQGMVPISAMDPMQQAQQYHQAGRGHWDSASIYQ